MEQLRYQQGLVEKKSYKYIENNNNKKSSSIIPFTACLHGRTGKSSFLDCVDCGTVDAAPMQNVQSSSEWEGRERAREGQTNNNWTDRIFALCAVRSLCAQ